MTFKRKFLPHDVSVAILNSDELAALVRKRIIISRTYTLCVAQSHSFHLHDCVIPHCGNNNHAYDQRRDIRVISVVQWAIYIVAGHTLIS